MSIQSISSHYNCKTKPSYVSFGRKALPIEQLQSAVFNPAEALSKTEKGVQCCLNYFARQYEKNKFINYAELTKINIPNLQLLNNKGVRGETLSSKSPKVLKYIKECGIDTIVDLRTTDYTKAFKDKCNKLNIEHIHIPIDKKLVPDREILDSLPVLFRVMERGKYYIACAQGKHRTDIALAINYVFNPKQKVPPFMSGHTKNHVTDMADINRRLNSLYKAMTKNDREKLGWPENYDVEFQRKKRVLKTYSEAYRTED